MSAPAVAALYDALQSYEGGRRGGGAYPVHKRLRLSRSRHGDVYDWLGDRLALRSTDRVLDVGCGVGFGTIRLAERGVAGVTGLTISGRELEHAARAGARSARAESIDFLEGSFDRLPHGPFDVIVAVESLKHSDDLRCTLGGLYGALAPGGRMVVVDDVFEGDPSCASARSVVRDWHLATLYAEADHASALSPAACRMVDLTSGVRPGGRVLSAGKLAALNVALLREGPSAAAFRAFRGGIHLERLYAAGMMRYVAMFWSKASGEPS
jgi:SAM-dependent methyltransferase